MRSIVCLISLALASLASSCFANEQAFLSDVDDYSTEAGPLSESCDCQYLDDSDQETDRLGFLPSDHCFDRFISPLSNPFYFEDPRALTEARGIFIDNGLPASAGGGDAHVFAMQLRGRVTENISVTLPRLAYWRVNQSTGDQPEGFMSAPIGVKFTLLQDVDRQFILAGGITYFIPGSRGSFTAFGDDVHLFLSAGKQILGRGHWISGSGFRLPLDTNRGTQMWYWSNQWDFELPGHFYPLVGLNWYHWLRSAGGDSVGSLGGLDLINLPAGGIAGTDVVTSVVGLKWKPSSHLEMGGGYEFPVTQDGDILADRAYVDVIFRY